MPSPDPSSIAESFTREPTVEAKDAAQAVDRAVAAWRRIDDALWPIVGHAGMAALFKRSLYLARVDHPALTPMVDAEIAPGDFALLREILAQQPGAAAAAAIQAGLLKTFLGLLTDLIGPALTERLLRSARAPPSGGEAVQDILL
ncbi:MAG TPA: hypothetical protein VF217_11760 [Rhodanobacteraceae bacterium]|jgi:hypothetical protein